MFNLEEDRTTTHQGEYILFHKGKKKIEKGDSIKKKYSQYIYI